jgi:hypothetical protein
MKIIVIIKNKEFDFSEIFALIFQEYIFYIYYLLFSNSKLFKLHFPKQTHQLKHKKYTYILLT